jgi:hypothetical protein
MVEQLLKKTKDIKEWVGQAKGLWGWWLGRVSPLTTLNDDVFEFSNGDIIMRVEIELFYGLINCNRVSLYLLDNINIFIHDMG